MSSSIRWDKLQWGEPTHQLLPAARRISKELGHYEVILPLHLLLAMLIDVRPTSLSVPQPEWPLVRNRVREFEPPWEDDLCVLSPGGQTPATKRILERAICMAQESEQMVQIEHLWGSICELEPELVGNLFIALDMET